MRCRPRDLDLLDLVSRRGQGTGDSLDRLDGVELSFFLRIRQAKVVGEGDLHDLALPIRATIPCFRG